MSSSSYSSNEFPVGLLMIDISSSCELSASLDRAKHVVNGTCIRSLGWSGPHDSLGSRRLPKWGRSSPTRCFCPRPIDCRACATSTLALTSVHPLGERNGEQGGGTSSFMHRSPALLVHTNRTHMPFHEKGVEEHGLSGVSWENSLRRSCSFSSPVTPRFVQGLKSVHRETAAVCIVQEFKIIGHWHYIFAVLPLTVEPGSKRRTSLGTSDSRGLLTKARKRCSTVRKWSPFVRCTRNENCSAAGIALIGVEVTRETRRRFESRIHKAQCDTGGAPGRGGARKSGNLSTK